MSTEAKPTKVGLHDCRFTGTSASGECAHEETRRHDCLRSS